MKAFFVIVLITFATYPESLTAGILDAVLAPHQAPVERVPPAPEAARPEAVLPPEPEVVELLTEERLISLLTEALRDVWAIDGELLLNSNRAWEPVALPNEENVAVELLEWPRSGPASRFTVRFKAVAVGEAIGEWRVSLRAEVHREVWVATRRLNRGDGLGGGAIQLQRVDVLGDRKAMIPADAELANHEVLQPLQPGQPLGWRDVSLRAVVKRGQVVDVIYREGSILITMKGQVMENGGVGEVVSIRNLTSRRDFFAEVINEGTVHVF